MHICIPDTREVRPAHGSAYLLYNVHIDGLYHCSLRYKQLHHLQQALSKRFPPGNREAVVLPSFPPKKLLPLTMGQVEDRRQALERYLQAISQDKQISNSSLFNMYLLEAQRESSSRLVDGNKHVHLDIELVNGQKIRLPIVTHDSVDSILTTCCRSLGLADQYHAYFCLCLCGYDVVSDKLIIKRRLSFFEAPFITLQMAIQQQEQLQSVLSIGTAANGGSGGGCNSRLQHSNHHDHYHSSSTSRQNTHSHHNSSSSSLLSSSSSSTYLINNNNNTNPCRCLSCSTTQAAAAAATASATAVPLVGSSSSQQQRSNACCCTNAQCTSSGKPIQQRTTATSNSLVTHRILLRKSYWDPLYDSYILGDSQALSLLFIQTVYDMKHSLMFVDRPTYQQLETLLAADAKLDYILLARTLKYYNYVHFEPCYSDYPRPRTKVMISIGSKELNMRVLRAPGGAAASSSVASSSRTTTNSDQVLYCTSSLVPYRGHKQLVTKEDLIEEEYNFKVPLIRCWRLTSLETLNSANSNPAYHHHHHQSSASTTAHATTTTLVAGGKRKSLSLFNSVVGSNTSSAKQTAAAAATATTSSNGAYRANDHGIATTATTTTGLGGTSLMATLMAHNGDTLNSSTGSNHQAAQPPWSGNNTDTPSNTNNTSSAQGNNNNNNNNNTSDSFFRFSSNANQTRTEEAATTITSSSGSSSTHTTNQQQRQHGAPEFPPDQHSTQQLSQYELSFEYLIAKDTLKWITISSDQAIFISISLQGVVDELVSRREMEAQGVVCGAPMELQHTHMQQQQQLHAPASVSRPIAIQQQSNGGTASGASSRHKNSQRPHQQQQPPPPQRQQLAESFTYLYRDGAQKSIKAKSQQQLLDRYCNGGPASHTRAGGPSLSSSAPSACSTSANLATARPPTGGYVLASASRQWTFTAVHPFARDS